MIGYLRGRVFERGVGSVVVDVGGVGYDVLVDKQTLEAIARPGEETALFVRTIVREDAITLFGFADAVTRDVFDLLMGVSGIGPKMASGVLGGMPLADFVQAVREKDLKRLSSISGVGKKTAERLCLELSEKFLLLPVAAPGVPAGIPTDVLVDVRSALANLGFGPRDVENAIRSLKAPAGTAVDLEDLVRLAIANLSTR